jgi:hypothetical protein
MIRVVLFILFTYGCRGQMMTPMMPTCADDLKKFLETNWIYNNDSAWYEGSSEFYRRMDSTYRPCVVKLNAEQIKTIFGKPTEVHSKIFMYKLVHCKIDACSYYQFAFDNDMMVKGFTIMRSSVSSHN